MNSRRKISANPRFTTRGSRQSGIALVIVLGFLVLITVLIVAYFTSVTTESAVSKTYANGAAAKMLSDTAVNVVMGQIAKGTQGQLPGTSTRLTWASQPGMIRTWDDTGTANDCYKLYSNGAMVVSGSAWAAEVQQALNSGTVPDVPSAWSSQPAIYTDLNAPVADSSGAWNFPIMSGNNLAYLFLNGSNEVTYRIGTSGTVEGFYVNPNTVPVSNYNPTVVSGTCNPAPMPVQWLYTLRDGTIISPDSGGNGTNATFQNTPVQSQPSAANPIVGRIAFWTDDETCKLNINTACEGTYYAQPRLNTQSEMAATTGTYGFAISPPATGEYTRYPGHPATTCLSVALGGFLDNISGKTAPNAYTSQSTNNAYLGLISGTFPNLSQTFTGLSAYTLLSPRNQIGGSLAGTVSESGSVSVLLSDTDRLFASVDELAFRYPASGDPQARTPFPNSSLIKSVIEDMKFFLTASSRAPELTPFNTPKVSMWPQWMSASDRNNSTGNVYGKAAIATEGLLAFCSSFGPPGANTSGTSPSGKFEYFIQRSSPAGYVSCTADWDGVLRNRQLANYLYNLGSRPIPGYGAAFTSAAGTPKYIRRNFSNIVLEAVDYIRSLIDKETYGSNLWISPLVVTGTTAGQYGSLPGVTGTVAAIKGYGSYPICTNIVAGAVGAVSGTAAATLSGTDFRPFVAFDYFLPGLNPNPGSYITSTWSDIENPGTLGLSSTGSQPLADPWTIDMGDQANWQDGTSAAPAAIKPYHASLAGSMFTLSGSSFYIGSSGNQSVTFDFPYVTAGVPAQRISVNFPQTLVPAPSQFGAGDNLILNLFSSGCPCSARGLEVTGSSPINGDWRLVGGFANIPPPQYPLTSGAIFVPSAGYYNQTYLQAHSMFIDFLDSIQNIAIDGTSSPMPTTSISGCLVGLSATTGPSLFTSGSYMDESAPMAPPTVQAALMANNQPGDWDNGPGFNPDGPLLNPPDTGSVAGVSQYYTLHNYTGTWVTGIFNPNREVSSPVQFGSLPTGICESPPQPWQTLLFCPNPAGRRTSATGTPTAAADHYGFTNPPDHLFLEFFTMPVVQPYAISEPLSTAGKVNLNYQLAPFTYIERSTALRGVLKNIQLTGISAYDAAGSGKHPSPAADNAYKWSGNVAAVRFPYELHYDINRDATIAGIEDHYFNQGQLFMYPSQICDVFLVPQKLPGATYNPQDAPVPAWPSKPLSAAYDSMVSWWNAVPGAPDPRATMSFTGDNMREEPYDRLYPRLTTKSNTYTVHYRVQVLQKQPNSNPAVWTEGQDKVVSENRGSSLIERYIDPADPNINEINNHWDTNTINVNEPSGGTIQAGTSCDLSQLYKFRVISTKQFAP